MSLDEIFRAATGRADVVRVRNALNPILWLCATGSPICFGAAYAFAADAILRYGLAGLGAFPIVAAVVAYLYFMLRNPDRLQSEEFVTRQQELMLLERKARTSAPASLDVFAEDSRIAQPGGEET